MENKIKHIAWEIHPIGKCERFRIDEMVTIRGDAFLVEHEYMRIADSDEWFEPFDDPDKNLLKDYRMYRQRNGLLDPVLTCAILVERFLLDIPTVCVDFGIDLAGWEQYQQGCLQTAEFDAKIRQMMDQLRAFYNN